MRAIRPRLRVPPGGWRALRREARHFRRRSDALSVIIVLSIIALTALCLGTTILFESRIGRLPPALQAIDDIRWTKDYRRGSVFTAAALANNGRLYLGTDNNGIMAYRTDSGWLGLWDQYTQAANGLPSDSIKGLTADAARLWAAAGGLAYGNLDGTHWQTLIGMAGFVPLGASAPPSRVRLSPDNRWLAVATANQGVGLYDTERHDWQSLTQASGLLPDDRITVLEFDPGGNLWIGTAQGLVMIQVGVRASPGSAALALPGQAVIDLSFGTNRIVALTDQGQVLTQDAFFNGQTWVTDSRWRTVIGAHGFSTASQLPQDIALAALTDQAIWLVTRETAVGRYDLSTHDWTAYPPLAPNAKEVRQLLVSGETVYLSAETGVYKLNKGAVTTLVTGPVRRIAADESRLWYVQDDGGVGYVDTKTTVVRAGGRFGPDSGPVMVTDVAAYAKYPDALWLAIPNTGIGVYDLKTHGWRNTSTGLPPDGAPTQLLDLNGSPALLVKDRTGKSGTALYFYQGESWARVSLDGQDVISVASASGGLWYKTASGGLYFTDGHPPTRGYFETAAPQGKIQAAAATTDALWLVGADSKQLWNYDLHGHDWTQFSLTQAIDQLAVSGTAPVALSAGRVIALGNDGSMQGVLFDAPAASGIDKNARITTAALFGDSIWFGTSTGKVYRYQPITHTLKEQSPEGSVDTLLTTAGGLWAVGGGALYRLDSGQWQTVKGLTGKAQRVIPFGDSVAVQTDKATLDWVSDGGAVSAQGQSGFAGLQDLTAAAVSADHRIWFGSASHGVGAYSPDLHAWATDPSTGSGAIRALVALPNAMLASTDTGILSYSKAGAAGVKEFAGSVVALGALKNRGWALVTTQDGPAMYERDLSGIWTAVRQPNAAPVDPNTISAVARSGNRFVFGTANGQVMDYDLARGVWRQIGGRLAVSRVDWIDIASDGSIWLTGPQDTMRRLIQIDANGAARVRSAPQHNVTSAGVTSNAVWYSETNGGVFSLKTGSVEPQAFHVPTPVLAGTADAARPTPTFTLSQQLAAEPVRFLAAHGDQVWLASDTVIYQAQENNGVLTAKFKTDIPAPVKRMALDGAGLLAGLGNNTSVRVESGKLTGPVRFDSDVLYTDSTWTWRQGGGKISVTLAGNPVPLVDSKLAFDDLQVMAANGSTMWLAGKGGAAQYDEHGLPVLFTSLPAPAQGLRFSGNTLLASLNIDTPTVKRFDDATKTWTDAQPNDYTAPVPIAAIGTVYVQVTDKGAGLDTPEAASGSNFRFDAISAIATDGAASNPKLFVQTPVGLWVTDKPLQWGTFASDTGSIKQYFSGSVQTQLATDKADPWLWSISQDRATGNQSVKITLRANPAVARQIDPASGAFADDVALSIANDPADAQALWVGTRGGLWKIDKDTSQRTTLIAAGQTVDTLQTTSVGLLARVNDKPQILKDQTFAPADAGTITASGAPRAIVKMDILGTLLQQDASGYTLPGLVDTPRHGYWFDQVGAFTAYNDRLWIVTPNGLLAYQITTTGFKAVRLDSFASVNVAGISSLAVGPLDSTNPDPKTQTVWALDSTGKIALTLNGDQWTATPLEKSPFVAGPTRAVPGDLKWTFDQGLFHAALEGRAVVWSHGRFDFDDVHDLTLQPGLSWLATAGGPTLILGNSTCKSKFPVDGLNSVNLDRITSGTGGQIIARDVNRQVYTLSCDKTPSWSAAPDNVSASAFAVTQIAFNGSKWLTRTAPDQSRPLAVDGLQDSQLFAGKRFSFDTVRDTTASGNSVWFATAGGAARIDSSNQFSLVLGGLPDLNVSAIRADDADPQLIRLAISSRLYKLNGNAWTADFSGTAVTDARHATFANGVWQSAPLVDSSLPLLAIKDAPPKYALFTSTGKFSFDDVQDITLNGSVMWLATSGGIVKADAVPENGSTLHILQITAAGLCGVPDAVRVQNDQPLVGYNQRTTGNLLGADCSKAKPWLSAFPVTFSSGTPPLTLEFANAALIARRDTAEVFRFTQTERLAGLFGSWLPMEGAKLVDVIDDGDHTWLIFDKSLVILRKDALAKRGIE